MHILALTAANPKNRHFKPQHEPGDGGPGGAGSAVAGSRGQTLGLHSTGNMLTVATASRTDRQGEMAGIRTSKDPSHMDLPLKGSPVPLSCVEHVGKRITSV